MRVLSPPATNMIATAIQSFPIPFPIIILIMTMIIIIIDDQEDVSFIVIIPSQTWLDEQQSSY